MNYCNVEMYPGVVDDIIISVKSDIDEYINADEIVIEWYPKYMRVRNIPRNTEE